MDEIRERRAARVLLFDPDQRLLLMKGRLASAPQAPGEWFTVGGGIEPGETVQEAARREVAEEAGFADAVVGPVVWRREGRLALQPGALLLVREQYVVAHCRGGDPLRIRDCHSHRPRGARIVAGNRLDERHEKVSARVAVVIAARSVLRVDARDECRGHVVQGLQISG